MSDPTLSPDSNIETPDCPKPGVALCLSGGGYRAMVFHVGALWRLNEAGLLPKLNRVSSVSGGSITSAVLALRWNQLDFAVDGVALNFPAFVDDVRNFARVTVDAGAVVGGLLLPGSINDRVVQAYKKHLFQERTLQSLPDERAGTPRFIFHATNIQSGALWRFEKKYMGDYRIGLVKNPTTSLAIAVAASSAFPPILSPAEMKIDQPMDQMPGNDLHYAPYTTKAVLADGGVYDNLALETAFKSYETLLVSDGGMKMSPDPTPAHDWARHSIRVLDVIDNQVRSLRKRFLIDYFDSKQRSGAYWGIATPFSAYVHDQPGLADPLGLAGKDFTDVAGVPTRLQAMDEKLQNRLINWGYAIGDAGLRTHLARTMSVAPPKGMPYPM